MPLSTPITATQTLSTSEWRERAAQYREKIEAVTIPLRERKSRHEEHPVYDFLHSYYSFSMGRLERWFPGSGVVLEDDGSGDFSPNYFRREDGRVWIDPNLLSKKGRERLQRILALLKRTQERPPHLACHGLHEWAMVYSGADVRHRESVPLRLPQTEIDALVSSRPIACSHYDAFRFFAPTAASFNKLSPTLATREENEQPGCIHVNMDLYKWAYKSSPWIASELLAETLFLAIEAREIDMRASPYDLSEYGYAPICVETPEGRRDYEKHQHSLFLKGLKLRAKLIESLSQVLTA
ncbi:hypothetical protein N9067_02600 [Akkermansiaceae bacterium]|nr:hypothetical protein [Akkermansiaceae bacterium]MDA8876252.1 hypothetical protein [Akkermansiaceae bacterium]MDA8967112.1 hypothetical protein [Akkermansiaceae bacterium]MDB4509017.1 hypothetical protein [Akkermansiaceae bacterium]MDB4570095.1 hypothetical protein [Akkermansiaceae bacterium]